MRLTGIIYSYILLASHEVHATTMLIDFDQVARVNYNAPYKRIGGLSWTNFGVVAASYQLLPKGLNEGVVSTPNVAFNLNASLPSTVLGRSFGLLDAWFSSWSDDNLQMSLLGFDRLGSAIYFSDFVVDTRGPTFHHFGWSNVASVTLSAESAVGQPRFSIDDVRLSIAVSEPDLSMLIGVAFVCCGLARAGKERLPL